jgi:hypothetical protein
MRKLASKMRDEVEEAEENKVEIRREDKTIKPFTIAFENLVGPIVTINQVGLMDNEHKVIMHKLPIEMKKHDRIMFT